MRRGQFLIIGERQGCGSMQKASRESCIFFFQPHFANLLLSVI